MTTAATINCTGRHMVPLLASVTDGRIHHRHQIITRPQPAINGHTHTSSVTCGHALVLERQTVSPVIGTLAAADKWSHTSTRLQTITCGISDKWSCPHNRWQIVTCLSSATNGHTHHRRQLDTVICDLQGRGRVCFMIVSFVSRRANKGAPARADRGIATPRER